MDEGRNYAKHANVVNFNANLAIKSPALLTS